MKATQETSREAYQYLIDNDLISPRVAEVLKALVDASGPMNQTMTHQAIIRVTGKVGLEKYSVSPRFAVLERMGLIQEAGRGACPVTGRTTVFYEPTYARPLKTETEATKNIGRKESEATLRRQNAELTEENAKLRELLDMRTSTFEQRDQKIRLTRVELQQSFL
jgi:hypothetical protein